MEGRDIFTKGMQRAHTCSRRGRMCLRRSSYYGRTAELLLKSPMTGKFDVTVSRVFHVYDVVIWAPTRKEIWHVGVRDTILLRLPLAGSLYIRLLNVI
jgi:hypothetical protein